MGRFRKSSKVLIEGRFFNFQKELEPEIWQLEDEATGRFHTYSRSQLNALLKSRKLVFVKATSVGSPTEQHEHIGLTEQEIELAKIRRSYVTAVRGIPSSSELMQVAIQQVWERLTQPAACPHPVTVQRWRARYEAADNDGMALLPQTHKRGNRKPRYEPEVEAFVQRAINERYMTRERVGIQAVLEYAKGLVHRENRQRPAGDQLKIPTRGMVSRRITRIPAYDRALARYGFHTARNKFRSVKGHVITDAPLERAEIDHTPLDLFVVDDESALPLGRPWLTLCVDHFTRCVLGIHIGFDPPSYLSVAQCLKHALLPKDDLRTIDPEIRNEWHAHGVMSQLVVDNGQEFHSVSFEEACFSLNVEILYAPSKTGWFKPVVERLLGTINHEVSHAQPGSTFRNAFEKEDYDASKSAVIRFATLKTILNRWIVDIYHQQVHSTLGCSPAAHWAANTRLEDIRLPDDVSRLDAILGSHEVRSLTHQGIQYEHLRYNSGDLAALRRRFGERLEVDIRVDRSNLGHIYVLTPDTRVPIRVPALNFQYADGLSLWQHKVCRRFAQRHLGSDMEWLEAKLRLSELIQGELMFKKQATRKGLARFKQKPKPVGPNSENVLAPIPVPPPQLESPVGGDSKLISSLMDVVPAPISARYRQRVTRD